MKQCFDVCVSLLSQNKGEPSVHHIVTCDEKWNLYDNRKRSASWIDKDEARKHSPKPNIHQKKLMVTAWQSSHVLIYYSFIKSGQSITAETCCIQLDIIIKNLAEKQPSLVNRDRPILLQDNARLNTANRTQLIILELYLKTIDHSPDLSPTDYTGRHILDPGTRLHFFKGFREILT